MANSQVILQTAEDVPDWNCLCQDSPQTTIFQSPSFIKIMKQTTGSHHEFLLLKNDQDLRAGMVLFTRRKFGFRLATLPFMIFYNSLLQKPLRATKPAEQLIESNDQWGAILNKVESRYDVVTISTFPGTALPLPLIWKKWEIVPQYTAILPIANLKKQWDQLHKDVRRQVRLGEKEKLIFRTGGNPESLYELLLQSYRKDQIRPPLSRKEFLAFLNATSAENIGNIFTVHTRDNKLLAGAFVLADFPSIYGLFLGRNVSIRPNVGTVNLLWNIANFYSEQGFKFFDLGGLQIESIARFKLQFGVQVQPYFKILYFKNNRIRLLFTLKEKFNWWKRRL